MLYLNHNDISVPFSDIGGLKIILSFAYLYFVSCFVLSVLSNEHEKFVSMNIVHVSRLKILS